MVEEIRGQREVRLQQAYEYIENAELGERQSAVSLALKALLVMRGALQPAVLDVRIYSRLAKYIRASNAQTLAALIDDVLRNISPDFVAHPTLGLPVEDIYQANDAPEALQLLEEETIPLVILLKRIYQRYVEPDEVSTVESEEDSITKEG